MKEQKNAKTRERLAARSEAVFQEDVQTLLHSGNEAGDRAEFAGERALWRAVITQALMDAGSESKKAEMKFERAQAISWLSGVSPDFSAICLMAGYDPLYVKCRAREAIARGCAWRKGDIRQKKRQKRMEEISQRGLQNGTNKKEKKTISG